MDKRDSEKMVQLAREGKRISKIWEEDFPQYEYMDIYLEVYGAGERTAQGVKKSITHRLNKLSTLPPVEQEDVIEEINGLVWHLYNRYKESQKRIDQIRSVIEG